MSYEASLKQRRDAESIFNTAIRSGERKGFEEGLQEGLQKGRLEERAKAEAEKREMARELKNDGLPLERIASLTKLSIEEVEKL